MTARNSSTGSVSFSPPSRRPPTTSTSLITERFDRIEARRAPRGVERRQERERQRHDDDIGDLDRIDLRGHLREEIDRRVEDIDAGDALDELADRLDVLGKGEAEGEAGDRPDDADRGTREHEDAE